MIIIIKRKATRLSNYVVSSPDAVSSGRVAKAGSGGCAGDQGNFRVEVANSGK